VKQIDYWLDERQHSTEKTKDVVHCFKSEDSVCTPDIERTQETLIVLVHDDLSLKYRKKLQVQDVN